jgi:deoxyadenosine/deoxycytidine kinase
MASDEEKFGLFFIGSKTNQESIYIDGNISSGKSTLCAKIRELTPEQRDVINGLPREVVIFYEIGHGDGVLAAYLKQRQELSALFQVHMLDMCSSREHRASLFMQMSAPAGDKRQLVIVDRSITGNGIFALANFVFAKTLSETDFEFYKILYNQAMNHVREQQAFAHGTLSVYLHVPVSTSIKRCADRDNIEEKEYNAEYFQSIERAAMVALLSNLSSETPHPQLILDWGAAFGKMDIFYDIIKAYTTLKGDGAVESPTKVTISHDYCDPKWVSQYSAILDMSFCETEDSFFSYGNVMMLMSLLCMRCPEDVSKGKHLFIKAPLCLSTAPFNGPFKLRIV